MVSIIAGLNCAGRWKENNGMLTLLLAFGLYTEAHLRFGDEASEETSTEACGIFWAFLAVGIVSLICFEVSWFRHPPPQKWTPRKPTHRSCKEKFRNPPKLNSVNVFDMVQPTEQLFTVLSEIGSDPTRNNICLDDICKFLGFEADKDSLKNYRLNNQVGPDGIERDEKQPESLEEEEAEENRIRKAHTMLREKPMLQEAVYSAWEVFVDKDEDFKQLQQRNPKEAHRWKENQRAKVKLGLRQIRNDPDGAVEASLQGNGPNAPEWCDRCSPFCSSRRPRSNPLLRDSHANSSVSRNTIDSEQWRKAVFEILVQKLA